MKKLCKISTVLLVGFFVFGLFVPTHTVRVFAQEAPITVCDSPGGTVMSYDQAVVSKAHGELIIVHSVDLEANRVTVTVTNNTPCSLPVSLASYKLFSPYSPETLSEQEFFDGTGTSDVAAGATLSLSVSLPTCLTQYDLWFGDVLRVIPNNRVYGEFLSGDLVHLNDICVHILTPLPTSTITVTKVVVNDNGGTKVVADFPLFVNGTGVTSGVANTFPSGVYTVTETANANYSNAFSGDCDATGNMSLGAGEHKTCTITNNDIPPASPPPGGGGGGGPPPPPSVPPVIDVVKTADPSSILNGSGLVTFTFTLRNTGTVPVTNVTMVDDTCSPVNFLFGDSNNDAKLDLNETWIYRCVMMVSQTHTNTVTATGWANGISTTDTAQATVTVSAPVVLATPPAPPEVLGASIPRFPNTGFSLGENILSNLVFLFGIVFAIGIAFAVIFKKQEL